MHLLKVDLSNRKVKITPAIAKDTIGLLETVDKIAIRENAVAAVNGSFFDSRRKPHLPIGILILDGKIINKSLLNRSAIGVTSNGDIIFGIPKIKGEVCVPDTQTKFFIWGINRPRKKDEVILYTPEYGDTTRTNKWGKEIVISGGRVTEIHDGGGTKIPEDGCVISFHGWPKSYSKKIPVGCDVMISFGLTDSWEMVNAAITAGPMLVKDGEIVAGQSIEDEGFDGRILYPTARTAVGVDGEGNLVFFVIDKKRKISVGATYDELAQIMIAEGIRTGMALDGGGPSTLYIDGEVKNFPMYGYPVPVSNALLVELEGYKYVAKAKPVIVLAKKPEVLTLARLEAMRLVEVTFEGTASVEFADALISDAWPDGEDSMPYSEASLSQFQTVLEFPFVDIPDLSLEAGAREPFSDVYNMYVAPILASEEAVGTEEGD